jgi:hypothetical protein
VSSGVSGGGGVCVCGVRVRSPVLCRGVVVSIG